MAELIKIRPFYNWHCHAAMTLLRGYGDNMPLQEWLQTRIWPREAKLTKEEIYDYSKLAIREMIGSGIVGFCDMYWMEEETVRAVEEMGVRANIGITVMDRMGERGLDEAFEKLERLVTQKRQGCKVTYSIAPHAIYTCGEKLLRRCAAISEKLGVTLQMHLSETKQEVVDCMAQHGGLSPVEYCERLGLLTSRAIFAHCVHLSDSDTRLLANTGAMCVHNPCSNMKLGSGTMRWREMIDAGVKIVMGTDGVSSNNNLSMFDEMKVAALQQSLVNGVTSVKAEEVLNAAQTPFEEIENGEDYVLVRADAPQLMPENDRTSNLVYSADTSVVDTVVCGGKTLMRGGKIKVG